MKKILNWTVGSMFRTIGRFFGLLLISCLFGFMLIKSGIKITDIFNLDTIKADTTYSWTTKQSRIYYDNGGVEAIGSWQNISYTHTSNYPITQFQYRLQYSGGLLADNVYKFKISFLPTPDALNARGIWFSDGTNTLTQVNCSGFVRESNGYYANICNVSPEVNISSSGYLYVRIVFYPGYVTSLRSYVGNFEVTKGTGAIIQDSAIDIMDNQNQNTQNIINNQNENAQRQNINDIDNKRNSFDTINNDCGDLYKYNMKKGKRFNNSGSLIDGEQYYYTETYIKLNTTDKIVLSGFGSEGTGTLIVYDSNKNFLDYWTVYDRNINLSNLEGPYYFRISTNMPTGMVFKNKGCKSKIDNLNDTLNDSDTSSASSDALDFFNNFNDNSHGLTSIITTPLNTIRLMLSDTCVAPHTIYKGKTISLPCGSILWSRPGANALKDFLNLVYGGLICYYIIVNLLSLVNDFKNPDNDKIEVADL